ncbi:MAG: hypothetical protein ACJAT2_003557 [Bacteriovoracaceae bacterium]
MRFKGIVLFILLGFFTHLSVNASETKLIKLDNELRTLHSRFQKDFLNPAFQNELEKKLVLSIEHRDQLIEHLSAYKKVFDELDTMAKDKTIIAGSTKTEIQEALTAKIILHTHGAKLFSEVLSFPGAVGVISEHKSLGSLPVDYIHGLMMDVAKGSMRKVRRQGRNGFLGMRNPRISELLNHPRAFSFWLKNFESKKSVYLIHELLDNYVSFQKSFYQKKKALLKNRILTKYLYKVKASSLAWLGHFALPAKNVMGPKYLKKMEDHMTPGDIAVVNQDGRLSNLVFNGTWSHGLMYLGPFNQMKELYSKEGETNLLYNQKCERLGMNCFDFISYMLEKFPKGFKKYAEKAGQVDEYTVIESMAPGVILSSTKDALALNRVAAFSPLLSRKDKALAIEEAFSNLGKPYDYNFDNRTYGRLVCTELILYSYMPDSRVNKEGLDWFQSVVAGTPAMYGYDLVETFFETRPVNRKLRFLFYFESPRSGDGVTEMDLAGLRGTVEPDLSLLD